MDGDVVHEGGDVPQEGFGAHEGLSHEGDVVEETLAQVVTEGVEEPVEKPPKRRKPSRSVKARGSFTPTEPA